MIETTDLPGIPEDLALRVIGFATKTIAPGLDDLPEGRDRNIAIAVLRGVAREAMERGSRLVKSQRVGSASVDYGSADSWFGADDRATLWALAAAAPTPGPIGHFPKPGLVGRIWPEQYDS